MIEMMTPEVMQGVGSAGAVTVLCMYFIKVFVQFHEKVTKEILNEMKEDREVFRDAVEKLDRRLEIQEKLIERLENRVDRK